MLFKCTPTLMQYTCFNKLAFKINKHVSYVLHPVHDLKRNQKYERIGIRTAVEIYMAHTHHHTC